VGRSRGEEEEEEGGEMASDPWKKQYFAMLEEKRRRDEVRTCRGEGNRGKKDSQIGVRVRGKVDLLLNRRDSLFRLPRSLDAQIRKIERHHRRTDFHRVGKRSSEEGFR